MTRVELARSQIQLARSYTLRLLADLSPDEWFRRPAEAVTHVAWQVGHLAMAEYRLTMERLRGIRTEDESVIPAEFLQRFVRDSKPDPDPENNPSADEIRAVFDRVHERAMAELGSYTDADLDEPSLAPHPLFNTKLGALLWCGQHEMLHAGQIGLLRRLFGRPPRW